MNIQEAIVRVLEGRDLSEEEMRAVMDDIMSGRATDAQIGGFLVGLRIKGETVEEITGAVRVMREKATPIETGVDVAAGEVLVDTCGTGGDGSGTFNVSTTAAFVVAGAGVPVAKHGNRAVSGKCGSADVLEALGVDLGLSPEAVARCVREAGIGFLFAPALHGAMKHAIGPRRELGVRTIFNILGPMTNPARANVQVMGVFDRGLIEPLAHVLARLGSRRALVVWGEGGLDEFSLCGETHVAEAAEGAVRTWTATPEEAGLSRAPLEALKGADTAEEAAAEVRAVLGGERGPKLDMVLLNAGAALMAAGRVQDLAGGVAEARKSVESGAALERLDALAGLSRELGKEA